jgi:hypothetical protein
MSLIGLLIQAEFLCGIPLEKIMFKDNIKIHHKEILHEVDG